jgi:ketosteroid isomerase-like protein
VMYASAIYVRCMDTLTEDDRLQIGQIHSSWVEFEVTGSNHKLMMLCADEIELWPPDEQPVCGHEEVAARLAVASNRIHSIEISGLRIRGSDEIAYLTARYKTIFSSAELPAQKRILGSHLWILRKHDGSWLVALVSWSVWR